MRQDNTQMFDKYIFFKYKTNQSYKNKYVALICLVLYLSKIYL